MKINNLDLVTFNAEYMKHRIGTMDKLAPQSRTARELIGKRSMAYAEGELELIVYGDNEKDVIVNTSALRVALTDCEITGLELNYLAVLGSMKEEEIFLDYMRDTYACKVVAKLNVYRKYGDTKSTSPNNGTLPAKPVFSTTVAESTSQLTYQCAGKNIFLQGVFNAGDVVEIDTFTGAVKLNGFYDQRLVTLTSDLEDFELPVGEFTIIMPTGTTYEYQELYL